MSKNKRAIELIKAGCPVDKATRIAEKEAAKKKGKK